MSAAGRPDLAARPRRAMVLAAGFGARLRPLTDEKPKPLVKVCGKPLIDHVLDRLMEAGVESVVVNLHYKGDMLRSHLTKRDDPDVRFSDESGELLDTGGGITKALPILGDAPFFTVNSDTLWEADGGLTLARMMRVWDDERMDCLMLLASTVQSLGYGGRGDFLMAPDGQLTRRPERHVAPFVWAGVQIVHPRLFAAAPEGPFSTNLLWDRAIEAGRLYGIRLDGMWMHVGSPEGVKQAESYLTGRLEAERYGA